MKNHPTPIEIYDMDIVSNYIVLLSMISPYTGRNNWYLYMQTEILFPRLLHVRKSIFIPCACWGGARGTPQVIKFSNLKEGKPPRTAPSENHKISNPKRRSKTQLFQYTKWTIDYQVTSPTSKILHHLNTGLTQG